MMGRPSFPLTDGVTGVGNETPPKGDKTGIPRFLGKSEEGRAQEERGLHPLHESLSAQSGAHHAEWGKLLTPPTPPPSPSFTSETDKEWRRRKNNLAFELVSLFLVRLPFLTSSLRIP